MQFQKKIVRNERFTIRLSLEEKEKLIRYAESINVAPSEFLRAVGMDYIDTHSYDVVKDKK